MLSASTFWNQTYMKSTYLAYGVGPVLAAAMGFLAAWGCVGFLDVTGLATVARDGINYGTNKGSSRAASIRGTEEKVPYATQVRRAP